MYVYIYICIYIYAHTYIHNGLLVIKKREILPFVTTWMALEGIMLSEISQTKKNTYCLISFICRILKKKIMDIENRMVFARGRVWGEVGGT